LTAVKAAVLPRAVAGQTPAGLKASVRRAVAKIDAAAAADRLARAVRDRQVRLDDRDDGMAALTVLLTGPVGRACREALSGYAKACEFDEDGHRDPRTHQQRMADCLADLILRPHADHPVVRVLLTLIAGVETLTGHGPGADTPGELEGDPVSAAQVRELAHQFGLLPRPENAAGADTVTEADAAPEAEADADVMPQADADMRTLADGVAGDPDRGDVFVGADDPQTRLGALRAAELAAARDFLAADAAAARKSALTRLLDTRLLLDTALAERPRIAVVDQLTGTLLALTDSTEIRAAVAAGRGLGPPRDTDAYQPSDPLHRFVRLRDRRCRFPGCRARARCCDLDHQVPHPHGPTAHDNLACLCEHHHRLSHQAPGWRLHRDPDGGLVWTLPSGRTITTYPPPFGTDDGTPTPPRKTGRQKYADALARIGNSRPCPPDPSIPF
jgi:hypothetical protein